MGADPADTTDVGTLAAPVVACAGVLRGAPSPQSAAVLAAWSYQPGEAPGTAVGPLAEVIDVVMAGRRLEGWALWCQLSALARLLAAWSGRPPRGDASRGGCDTEDPALAGRLDQVADGEERGRRRYVPDEAELAPAFVAAEVGLSCGLSRTAASYRVSVAQALLVDGRHPRVAVLARAGFLEWGKLHLLVTRLGQLQGLVCECVEELLIPDEDLRVGEGLLDVRADPRRPGEMLPAVTRRTLPQLRADIDAAIAAVDPDGLAERAARARADRRVYAVAEPDGMARLEAYGPAEAVTAAMNDLDAAAITATAAGDPRTRDQISADELFYRLTGGAYGAPALPHPHPADDPADAADDTDGADGAAAGSGRGVGRAGRGGLAVGLTMPLATWLGLAGDPGQLAGYGPVAAALARQIAADAARDHPSSTTWHCVITDDRHATVIGLGRPVSTPRHDPPPRLAALLRAAEPTCVFPGCTVPVRACDLDHREPYPHGPTCACNLQPLCRGHHRLKTSGLISVRLLHPGEDATAPPGTLEWTTRAGLTYRRPPARPVPSALVPALAGLPARLAHTRATGAAELRDLNADLRAAFTRSHLRHLDQVAAHHPLDDTDETIQRPPPSIDDDPAPPPPQRPLETWNENWERTPTRLSA